MGKSDDKYRFFYNGFEFVMLINGTLSVTKYTGNDTSLVVPESVKGYTVSCISRGAFEHCTNLTHIEIPACIELIYQDSFPMKNTRPSDLERASAATCRRDMEYMFGYDYMSIESQMIGIERGVADYPKSSSSPSNITAAVVKGSYAEDFCKRNDIKITRYL